MLRAVMGEWPMLEWGTALWRSRSLGWGTRPGQDLECPVAGGGWARNPAKGAERGQDIAVVLLLLLWLVDGGGG